MNPAQFLKAISSVNSMWSIAAFAIAAVLGLVSAYLRSSAKDSGKTDPKASQLATTLLWGGMAIILVMGIAPIAANGLLETQRIRTSSIYHLRVTVLDAQNVPVTGAHVRTTVSGEAATTAEGETAIAIARGSMPADGKVTLFADKDSAFLHGSKEVQLADDVNPSVLINLTTDTSASVTGMVEDFTGHAIADAVVSLPGGASTKTSETGNFTLSAHAGPGQAITLHVEKRGFEPVDQSHLAGIEPATIVLKRESH